MHLETRFYLLITNKNKYCKGYLIIYKAYKPIYKYKRLGNPISMIFINYEKIIKEIDILITYK